MAIRPCVRNHSAGPGPGLPAARWTFGQAREPHLGGSAPAPRAATLRCGIQMSMRGGVRRRTRRVRTRSTRVTTHGPRTPPMIDRRPRIDVSLPPRLAPLGELAANAWTSWNADARALFARLDRALWRACEHSPARLLGELGSERLERAAADEPLVAELSRVHARFRRELDDPGWFARDAASADVLVAYFSREFGIHESLPIYSGGLGVLAGDHLKSASATSACRSSASACCTARATSASTSTSTAGSRSATRENDFFNLPLHPRAPTTDGAPLVIARRRSPASEVARAHLAAPGRPRPALPARHQHPAEQPRGPRHHRPALRRRPRHAHPAGDRPRHRRRPGAASRWATTPTVCHMNEGHSAFLRLERIRELIDGGELDFADAPARRCAAGTGLHHPHAGARRQRRLRARAGRALLRRSARPRDRPGRPRAPGARARRARDDHEPFGMTVLALRTVAHRERRQQAARRGVAQDVARPLAGAARRRGADQRRHQRRPHAHLARPRRWPQLLRPLPRHPLGGRPARRRAAGSGSTTIPDAELWRTHERRRERLVAFARGGLSS